MRRVTRNVLLQASREFVFREINSLSRNFGEFFEGERFLLGLPGERRQLGRLASLHKTRALFSGPVYLQTDNRKTSSENLSGLATLFRSGDNKGLGGGGPAGASRDFLIAFGASE